MGSAGQPQGVAPVETLEFAQARGIDDEVTFSQWVLYMLWKHNMILSAMKS